MRKISRNKKIVSLIIAALFLCICFAGCSPAVSEDEQEQVRGDSVLEVSEIVSSNFASYAFDAIGSADWIEFHNNSSGTIDLEGYSVMAEDKPDAKYTFGSISIEPDGYLVAAATDSPGADGLGFPVTGFRLAKEGFILMLKILTAV